jgi:hypothetical protein
MIGNIMDAPKTVVASADHGTADAITASVAGQAAAPAPAAPAPPVRVADASAPHRLVMEIHVPGSPAEPLVWTRARN